MYLVTDNEPVIVSHDPVLSSAPHKFAYIHTIKYTQLNTSKQKQQLSTYLVPRSVVVSVSSPVLTAFNIKPHTTRPGILAVAVQVIDQSGQLGVSAGRAGGTWVFC